MGPSIVLSLARAKYLGVMSFEAIVLGIFRNPVENIPVIVDFCSFFFHLIFRNFVDLSYSG